MARSHPRFCSITCRMLPRFCWRRARRMRQPPAVLQRDAEERDGYSLGAAEGMSRQRRLNVSCGNRLLLSAIDPVKSRLRLGSTGYVRSALEQAVAQYPRILCQLQRARAGGPRSAKLRRRCLSRTQTHHGGRVIRCMVPHSVRIYCSGRAHERSHSRRIRES